MANKPTLEAAREKFKRYRSNLVDQYNRFPPHIRQYYKKDPKANALFEEILCLDHVLHVLDGESSRFDP